MQDALRAGETLLWAQTQSCLALLCEHLLVKESSGGGARGSPMPRKPFPPGQLCIGADEGQKGSQDSLRWGCASAAGLATSPRLLLPTPRAATPAGGWNLSRRRSGWEIQGTSVTGQAHQSFLDVWRNPQLPGSKWQSCRLLGIAAHLIKKGREVSVCLQTHPGLVNFYQLNN